MEVYQLPQACKRWRSRHHALELGASSGLQAADAQRASASLQLPPCSEHSALFMQPQPSALAQAGTHPRAQQHQGLAKGSYHADNQRETLEEGAGTARPAAGSLAHLTPARPQGKSPGFSLGPPVDAGVLWAAQSLAQRAGRNVLVALGSLGSPDMLEPPQRALRAVRGLGSLLAGGDLPSPGFHLAVMPTSHLTPSEGSAPCPLLPPNPSASPAPWGARLLQLGAVPWLPVFLSTGRAGTGENSWC